MVKSFLYGFALLLSLQSLADEVPWRSVVTHAIDEMIAKHANDPEKPVAVFDWDNTMAKHDVSDAVFHEMLARNMIFAPLGDDLRLVNKLFTDDAINAVKKNCKRITRENKQGYLLAGTFYETKGPVAKACRQEFLRFYHNEMTSTGKSAFDQGPKAFNRRTMKPSYLWVTQLFAGMTRADVHALTNEVLDLRLTPEAKARRSEKIDEFEVPSFLEVYDPMSALVAKLINKNFEVWIVSASPQYVVETFAERLDKKVQGLFFSQKGRNFLETSQEHKTLHVIGVQVMTEQGEKASAALAELGITHVGPEPVLVNRVRGCGFARENEIITYINGKTCFIDVGIFGGDGKGSAKRPVFAAGDATTDVAMLQSAAELALVINRNYPELMCNAYQKSELGDKKWIVQPMFIDPCPKRQQGYECQFVNEKGDPLVKRVRDSVFVPAGSGKLDLDCRR